MAAKKSLKTANTSSATKKTTTQSTKTSKTSGTKKTNAKASTKTQQATPQKPPPPTVTVTDASSPDQILRSSWKFFYCFQFLSLFRSLLKLPVITIETFENALKVTKEPSLARSEGSFLAEEMNNSLILDSTRKDAARQTLEQILVALLKHVQSQRVNTSNCHGFLYDFLVSQQQHNEENDNSNYEHEDECKLSKPKNSWTIWDLAVPVKIRVLKSLIDRIEKTDQIVELRAGKAPEDMRLAPIGDDAEGWRYWMFDDMRLYRELPMPQKKGLPLMRDTDYTFEMVCDTLESWQSCLSRFSVKTRNHNGKALGHTINEIAPQIIAKLEAKQAAKAREEARLEKQRLLEALPRKRSRRLEVKEEELSKRLKTDELEQQQIAVEQKERRQQREQEKIEQEQVKQTELDLKDYVYNLIDTKLNEAATREEETGTASETRKSRSSPSFVTPEIAFLTELRGILRKSAPEEERVAKMQGWALLLDDENIVHIGEGSNGDAPLVLGQGLVLKGAGASGDLTSPLLKNILRVFLSTLPNETTDMGMDLPAIRKKLLLDRYTADENFSGLENFIQDLDLALPAESERLGAVSPQRYAASLLTRIFQ
ncbi:hypothetical protein BDB00DRAFT_838253 [Zychaea mexicana]|uniref:uncharacterized protein n=1 Tax=Zychaea mexicana TaxID=64656 RepID=UPI0022FF1837|nr:uncharacterized protein BDB00DRAFT_838253 [Zychaea mexicana]KAI9490379.1 hypothetical protein BDB00DRAFT_838253 [Zychaea mexicana]